jgi:hypothetical protein
MHLASCYGNAEAASPFENIATFNGKVGPFKP